MHAADGGVVDVYRDDNADGVGRIIIIIIIMPTVLGVGAARSSIVWIIRSRLKSCSDILGLVFLNFRDMNCRDI